MIRHRVAPRAGAVVPLVAILIIFLFAMIAFAIDLGYIAVVNKELQNAADSAALAGGSQLLDRGLLKGSPNQLAMLANARAVAQQFSTRNYGGGVALNLDGNTSNDTNGDIVFGNLSNPDDLSSPLDTSAATYNSIQTRPRRTAAQNGSLGLFFGPVLGRSTQDVTARATATYQGGSSVTGFSFAGTSVSTMPFLPITVDINTWNAAINGTGPDNWNYNPDTQTYAPGSDGIKEFDLFPTKGSAPGNFGTVDLGSPNNSTSDVARQILNGLNPFDLSFFPGNQIALGSDGTLTLQGDTGVSTGFSDALSAIRGQKRIIPIYQPPAVLTGNNTQFTIIGFAGVTILDVKLTGLNKHLTVQPEFVFTPTAMLGGNGLTTPNWFVYRPLRLTR
jgi:Flp pilus assembly protein TadG